MGSTFYYLGAPGTDSSVLEWFAALPEPPLIRNDQRALMWCEPLGVDERAADPAEQPVVTLFPPKEHREDVWTVGEVHFLAPRGRHPIFDVARARFYRWLNAHTLVYRGPTANGGCEEWNWQLRGSVRNIAPSVRALPSGEGTLRAGVYFVAARDNATTVAAVIQEIDRLR
ncbi:hypothetical protein ACQE98_17420 [Ornithinimicrobium sp. W1679]|uniref:hypothetical protein n=1 Tax=Ornithinimicrobium sp. W1679 TaxID=3418770 RepID=UPI003CFB16EC